MSALVRVRRDGRLQATPGTCALPAAPLTVDVQRAKSRRWFSFKAEAEPPTSHVFSIETPDRVYKFAANSEEDMLDWAKALSSAMRPEGALMKEIAAAHEASKADVAKEREARIRKVKGVISHGRGDSTVPAPDDVDEAYSKPVPEVDAAYLQRGPPTHLLIHVHHLAGVPRLLGKGVADGARLTVGIMLADTDDADGHVYTDELRYTAALPSKVVRACNGVSAFDSAGTPDVVPTEPAEAEDDPAPSTSGGAAASTAADGAAAPAATGAGDAPPARAAEDSGFPDEESSDEEQAEGPGGMELPEEADDFDEDVCPLSATFSFLLPAASETQDGPIPDMQLPDTSKMRIALRLHNKGLTETIAKKRHLVLARLPTLDGQQIRPYHPQPLPLRVLPPEGREVDVAEETAGDTQPELLLVMMWVGGGEHQLREGVLSNEEAAAAVKPVQPGDEGGDGDPNRTKGVSFTSGGAYAFGLGDTSSAVTLRMAVPVFHKPGISVAGAKASDDAWRQRAHEIITNMNADWYKAGAVDEAGSAGALAHLRSSHPSAAAARQAVWNLYGRPIARLSPTGTNMWEAVDGEEDRVHEDIPLVLQQAFDADSAAQRNRGAIADRGGGQFRGKLDHRHLALLGGGAGEDEYEADAVSVASGMSYTSDDEDKTGILRLHGDGVEDYHTLAGGHAQRLVQAAAEEGAGAVIPTKSLRPPKTKFADAVPGDDIAVSGIGLMPLTLHPSTHPAFMAAAAFANAQAALPDDPPPQPPAIGFAMDMAKAGLEAMGKAHVKRMKSQGMRKGVYQVLVSVRKVQDLVLPQSHPHSAAAAAALLSQSPVQVSVDVVGLGSDQKEEMLSSLGPLRIALPMHDRAVRRDTRSVVMAEEKRLFQKLEASQKATAQGGLPEDYEVLTEAGEDMTDLGEVIDTATEAAAAQGAGTNPAVSAALRRGTSTSLPMCWVVDDAITLRLPAASEEQLAGANLRIRVRVPTVASPPDLAGGNVVGEFTAPLPVMYMQQRKYGRDAAGGTSVGGDTSLWCRWVALGAPPAAEDAAVSVAREGGDPCAVPDPGVHGSVRGFALVTVNIRPLIVSKGYIPGRGTAETSKRLALGPLLAGRVSTDMGQGKGAEEVGLNVPGAAAEEEGGATERKVAEPPRTTEDDKLPPHPHDHLDPHAPNPGMGDVEDARPAMHSADWGATARTPNGRPLNRRHLPLRLGYEGIPTAPLVLPPTLTPRMGSLIITLHKIIDLPAMDAGIAGLSPGIDAYVKVACGGAVVSTYVNTIKGKGVLQTDVCARIVLPVWLPLPTYGQARSLTRGSSRSAAAAVAAAAVARDHTHAQGAWPGLRTGSTTRPGSCWALGNGREVGGWGLSSDSARVPEASGGKAAAAPSTTKLDALDRVPLEAHLAAADASRDPLGVPSAATQSTAAKAMERAAAAAVARDYDVGAVVASNVTAPSITGGLAGGGQDTAMRHAGFGWNMEDGCQLSRVTLGVWDHDSVGNDDRVACTSLSLADIMATQALRTEHQMDEAPDTANARPLGAGPIWLPLHGARLNKDGGVGVFSSEGSSTAAAMNSDPRLGKQYRGAILASFRIVEWAEADAGLAEREADLADSTLWLRRGMGGSEQTLAHEENHDMIEDMGLLLPQAPFLFAPPPDMDVSTMETYVWPPPLMARMHLRHVHPLQPLQLFQSLRDPSRAFFTRYAVAAMVLSGTDLPFLLSRTNVGQPSKMHITVALGPQFLISSRETQEAGRVYWHQLLTAADWVLPANPSALPDLFVYLTDRDGRHIAQGRIPAARVISTRWGTGPFWIPLIPDETTGVVDVHKTLTPDDRAGSVAVWLGMGPLKELFKSRSKKHRQMRKRLRAARAMGLKVSKEQIYGGAAAHFESGPAKPLQMVPVSAARRDEGAKQERAGTPAGEAAAGAGSATAAGEAAAAAPTSPRTLDEFMEAQAAAAAASAAAPKLKSVHTLHDKHGKMKLLPSMGHVEEPDDDTLSISSQSTTNSVMSGVSAYSETPLTAPTRGKKDPATGKRAPRQREKLVDLSKVTADTVAKRLGWEASLAAALDMTKRYQLRLFVYQARHLPAVDWDGASDPYLRVRLGEVFRDTRTVTSTLNPVWGSTVVLNANLPPYPLAPELLLEVWDKNILRDKRLGMTRVSLADAMMVDTERLYNREVAKLDTARGRRLARAIGHVPITLDISKFIPTPFWVPMALEHGGAWRAGDGVGATYGSVVAFAHPRTRGQHVSAVSVGAGSAQAPQLQGAAQPGAKGTLKKYSPEQHASFYRALQWLAPSAANEARRALQRSSGSGAIGAMLDAAVKLNMLAESELGPSAPCVPELLLGMQLVPRVMMSAAAAGKSWGTNMVEDEVPVPLSPPPQLLPPTRDVKVHMVVLYAYGLGSPVGIPSGEAQHPEVTLGFTGVYRKGKGATSEDGSKNYSASKTTRTLQEVTAPVLASGTRDVGTKILQAFAGAGAAIGRIFTGGDDDPVPPPVLGLPTVAGAYARYNARLKAGVVARAAEVQRMLSGDDLGGASVGDGDGEVARRLAPAAAATAERVLWEFSTRRYFVNRVELEVGLPDVAQLVWQVQEDNADVEHRDKQETWADEAEAAAEADAKQAAAAAEAHVAVEKPDKEGGMAPVPEDGPGDPGAPSSPDEGAARPEPVKAPKDDVPDAGGGGAAAADSGTPVPGQAPRTPNGEWSPLGAGLPSHQLRALRAWAASMAPRIRLSVAEGAGILGLGVGDDMFAASTTSALTPLPPAKVYSATHKKGHIGDASMPLPLGELWWATPGSQGDDLGDDEADAAAAAARTGMFSPHARKPSARVEEPPAGSGENIAAGRIQAIARRRLLERRRRHEAGATQRAFAAHARARAQAAGKGGAAGKLRSSLKTAIGKVHLAGVLSGAASALTQASEGKEHVLLSPAETDGLAVFRAPPPNVRRTKEELYKMLLSRRRLLRRRAVYPLPLEDMLPRHGNLFRDYPVYTHVGATPTGATPRMRHKIAGLVRAAVLIEDLSETRSSSQWKYKQARQQARNRASALEGGIAADAARTAVVEGMKAGHVAMPGMNKEQDNMDAIAAAASTRSLYVQRVLALGGTLQKVKVRVYAMSISAALSCVPRSGVSYVAPALRQEGYTRPHLEGPPGRLGVSLRVHVCGQSVASKAVQWQPRSISTYQRLEQDIDEAYLIPGTPCAFSKFGANRRSIKGLATDLQAVGQPIPPTLQRDLELAQTCSSTDRRQPYDQVADIMQCMEIETTLPGVPLMTLEVWHTYATDHVEVVPGKPAKPGGKEVKKLRRTRRYHEALIGGTIIDLEQRWLHPAWHSMGGKYHVTPESLTEAQRQTQGDLIQFHPVAVETRQLVAPSCRAMAVLEAAGDPGASTELVAATSSHGTVKLGPLEVKDRGGAVVPDAEGRLPTDNTDVGVTTGAMQLWVDIMTAEEAKTFPPLKIERPPKLHMVFRVTVWRVRRIVRIKSSSRLADLMNLPKGKRADADPTSATNLSASAQQALAQQAEFATWWPKDAAAADAAAGAEKDAPAQLAIEAAPAADEDPGAGAAAAGEVATSGAAKDERDPEGARPSQAMGSAKGDDYVYFDVPMPPFGPPLERDRIAHKAATLRALHSRKRSKGGPTASIVDNLAVGANVAVAAVDTVLDSAGEVIKAVDNKAELKTFLPPSMSVPPSDELANRYTGQGTTSFFARACLLDPVAKHKDQDTLDVDKGDEGRGHEGAGQAAEGKEGDARAEGDEEEMAPVHSLMAPASGGVSQEVDAGLDTSAFVRPTHESWLRAPAQASKVGSVVPQLTFVPQGMDPAEADEVFLHGGDQPDAAADDDDDELPDADGDGEPDDVRTGCVKCLGCCCHCGEMLCASIICSCCSGPANCCIDCCACCCGAYKEPVPPPMDVKVESEHTLFNWRMTLPVNHEKWGRCPPPDRLRIELCRTVPREQLITSVDLRGSAVAAGLAAGVGAVVDGVSSVATAATAALIGGAAAEGKVEAAVEAAAAPAGPVQDRLGYVDVPIAQAVMSAAAQASHTITPVNYAAWEGAQRQWVAKDNHLVSAHAASVMGGAGVCTEGVWLPVKTHAVPHVLDAAGRDWGIAALPPLEHLDGSDRECFQVLVSAEMVPEALAEEYPAGFGRAKPNLNPVLYNPSKMRAAAETAIRAHKPPRCLGCVVDASDGSVGCSIM